MNIKRIFGPFLIILGIVGLIWSAVLFLNNTNADWKTTLVFAVLGIIFFSSGLGLIKSTQDKA